MSNGFFRIASAVPSVKVADVGHNIASIYSMLQCLEQQQVQFVVFPELCVTGYTCGDLFHNETLLRGAREGLMNLVRDTAEMKIAYVVGLPLVIKGDIYNCAAVVSQGEVHCIIPKTYIPNYNEFYEKRWFSSAPEHTCYEFSDLGGMMPFGPKCKIQVDGVYLAVEICEDLWTPLPPSTLHALSGAEVIVNLSASDALIGKLDYIKKLVAQQSARNICAYAYAGAGFGESSTDLVFDGIAMIAENGTMLASNTRWTTEPQYVVADIDIEAIHRDRLHQGSFSDTARRMSEAIGGYDLATITVRSCNECDPELIRHINPHPFVPSSASRLDERCEEIINIQSAGLAKRLAHTHCKSLVVGISGGLDSTLALLVAVKAFKQLGLDTKGILGVTMPGFGTTGRTHNNALKLMEILGVTSEEISIVKSVTQHFEDICHDMNVHDVTYENCQARERTQILMDLANKTGGMVLGTGDLSELALGWATYNGDHMSMYGVNAGVPKTLVRHLVNWFAMKARQEGEIALCETLADIVDTPISPELIPADENGNIKQKTEDLVGPYELHDFFLYYMLRYGFSPTRVLYLAEYAFDGVYDSTTILKWMREFYRRFFQQQFKRSCLPDGPKVGSVCLSPRGDWRMPSDASATLWLNEVDELVRTW